jgi:hypothetical protein
LDPAVGQAPDESVELKNDQPGAEFARRETEVCCQDVGLDRVVSDRGDDRVLVDASGVVGRERRATSAGPVRMVEVGVDLGWRKGVEVTPRRQGGQLVDDLARRLDQQGALPDQRMAAA